MTYNFPNHETGDTFVGTTFTVIVNLVALDLIGAIIIGTFKMSTNKNIVHTLTSTAGQITIAAGGIFVIPEQKLSWPKGIYDYDIKFYLVTGKVKTYISGTWEITN